jgi:osmoprotectant transport system permease protein
MLGSLFVDALEFIPDHAQLLLDKTVETAELAFAALGISLLVALPVGLWLGHKHRGLFIALGCPRSVAPCRASRSSES